METYKINSQGTKTEEIPTADKLDGRYFPCAIAAGDNICPSTNAGYAADHRPIRRFLRFLSSSCSVIRPARGNTGGAVFVNPAKTD
jgi:hypothetical protein